MNCQETFSFKFPVAPQIFVCEGRDGAWVFPKVDRKDEEKFTWAATMLGGGKLPHTTVIQWVALSRKAKTLDSKPEKIEVARPRPSAAAEKATNVEKTTEP